MSLFDKRFGVRSQRIMQTLDPDWWPILNTAVRIMDFSVVSGFRGKDEQDDLFRRGLSKRQWPDSRHNFNPSQAVDLVPYPFEPKDWKDGLRFARLAGVIFAVAASPALLDPDSQPRVTKPPQLRWGGDWDGDTRSNDQGFMDLGHFELVDLNLSNPNHSEGVS